MHSIKYINLGNELEQSTIAMNSHPNQSMKPNTSFVAFPTLQLRDLWYGPLLLSTLLLHTNDAILNTLRRTLLLQISLSLVHVCDMYHGMCVLVRGQLVGVGSVLEPCGLGLNSGIRCLCLLHRQSGQQVPISTTPSSQPPQSLLCAFERDLLWRPD